MAKHYAPEFKEQKVELVRSGRSAEELGTGPERWRGVGQRHLLTG